MTEPTAGGSEPDDTPELSPDPVDSPAAAEPTSPSPRAAALASDVPEFTATAPLLEATLDRSIVSLDSAVKKERPFNPEQQLAKVRARLAYSLLGVLVGVIVLGAAVLFTLPWTGVADIVDIRPTFELVFTGILTLVSSATGFYFGQQSVAPGGGPSSRS